jgi:hypothetical protein
MLPLVFPHVIYILPAMKGMWVIFGWVIFVVLCSSGYAAGPAFASDTSNQSSTVKRQAIKDCMTRKMSADKTLSYIAAAKACTALSKPPVNETASNTPVKQ